MGSSVSVRGPLLGMEISGETEGRGAPKKALIAASISPLEDSRKNLALAGSTQPVTWQNWAILSSMAAGTWEGNALASGFVSRRDVTALQSEQLLVSAFHLFGAPLLRTAMGPPLAMLARASTVASSSKPRPSSSRLSARRRLSQGLHDPLLSPSRRGEQTSGRPRARGRRAPIRVTTRAASICGIDLGTTNSAVAVVVDGKPIIVADKDGNRTVPSVVSFAPDGTVLVGHDARRRLAKDPANTFSSVKRFIGKSFDSKTVKDDAKRVPYEVVAAPDGVGVALRSPAAGRDVTPIEVSQHIIATMLNVAEDGTDVPRGSIKRAVVTVPAYFDDAQCAATIEAGRAAGLEKVKLLHEPVAAALAYGVDVVRLF